MPEISEKISNFSNEQNPSEAQSSGGEHTDPRANPDFYGWLIDYLGAHRNETNQLDVIAAGCGCGKSRSVTSLIADTLQGRQEGVLVVTDEVNRLKNYVDSEGSDSELRDYLARNNDRILVLTNSNLSASQKELYTRQVVCMTTQRFFNLEREELNAIVNSRCPKRFIIFDERIPLSEAVSIDIETFNTIDTELNKQLDDTCAHKEWLLCQWRNLRQRYDEILRRAEASHDDAKLCAWFVDDDPHMSTDDNRFMELITKTYKRQLRRKYPNLIRDVKAVAQIVHEGGLLISHKRLRARSSDEYETKIIAVIDHGDLIHNLNTKAVVLDGSAEIDPVYRRWDVNIVSCPQFKRDLRTLTIRLIDVNTSKAKLTHKPNENKLIQAIKDYVRVAYPRKPQAVFTYLNCEEAFEDIANSTGHFGAIRGSNAYREMTDLLQIGLHRYNDEVYLALALHAMKLRYPPNVKHKILFDREAAKRRIMLELLLCDIEQNLFRCAIRNPDNTRQCTYTLVYSYKSKADKNGIEHNELSGLLPLIRERFESQGAQIVLINTPTTVLQLKTAERKSATNELTKPQRIDKWLDSCPPGTRFKTARILNEFNMTYTQFKEVLRRNAYIKQRLDSMRTDKRGWYQVPCAH